MLFRVAKIFLYLLLLINFTATAIEVSSMKEDKGHVFSWNKFARDLLVLHKKQIENREVEVKKSIGGYVVFKNFYKEELYYDKKSKKLLSKLQWERKNPKLIHSIEVYVRDKKGRVLRDYSASYLPQYRNAPAQTLINFHGYGGKMHGFRQFDVSADLIYEKCEGTFKGKKVTIRMFEDMLYNGGPETEKLMKSGPYKACFSKVPKKIKKGMIPY